MASRAIGAHHVHRRPIVILFGGVIASVVLVGIALIVHGVWRAEEFMHPARTIAVSVDLPGSEIVSFTASDGTVLAGTYLAPRNGASVVLAHGFGADRWQLLPEARLLAENGYGVLLYDARAHGESGGSISTWGDRESSDVESAVDLLVQRSGSPDEQIGAVGFSMGGTAVTRAAASDERIKAVVIEATFTSPSDEFRQDSGPYAAITLRPMLLAMQLSGMDLDDMHPDRDLCTISPRPLLLVYGNRDAAAPEDVAMKMASEACGPSSLLLINTDEHGQYIQSGSTEYAHRLSAFFTSALLSGTRSALTAI